MARSGLAGVWRGVFFAPARARRYSRLNADRLVAVTGAASNVTIYGYDTENNMVDITDAMSHNTQFTYDAMGRVTQVTFPRRSARATLTTP